MRGLLHKNMLMQIVITFAMDHFSIVLHAYSARQSSSRMWKKCVQRRFIYILNIGIFAISIIVMIKSFTQNDSEKPIKWRKDVFGCAQKKYGREIRVRFEGLLNNGTQVCLLTPERSLCLTHNSSQVRVSYHLSTKFLFILQNISKKGFHQINLAFHWTQKQSSYSFLLLKSSMVEKLILWILYFGGKTTDGKLEKCNIVIFEGSQFQRIGELQIIFFISQP